MNIEKIDGKSTKGRKYKRVCVSCRTIQEGSGDVCNKCKRQMNKIF